MTTMRDEGCNGWTNYETWSVEVILDNDEGLDRRRTTFVRNNLGHSVKPAAAMARVREWVEGLLDESRSRRHPRRPERAPRAVDAAARALLALAVERIDWGQLARSWGEALDDNAERPAARQAAREARAKQWAKFKPLDLSAPPPAEHKAATAAVAALLKPRRRALVALLGDQGGGAVRDAMKEYVEHKLHEAGWTAPEGLPINGLITQLIDAGLSDVDLHAMADEWLGLPRAGAPEREPLTDLTGCDV